MVDDPQPGMIAILLLQEVSHTRPFGGLGLSGRSGYRPPSPRWLKLWRCSRPG